MDQLGHAQGFALLKEAVTVLFCLVDDAYAQPVKKRGCRLLREFYEPQHLAIIPN
jgi:hypothetical protein